MADLDALDDHDYREAQIHAGAVDARLHLGAYAAGLGASGMTFADDELTAFLGTGEAGLLITCVGVPAHGTLRAAIPGERSLPMQTRDT